MSRKKKLKEPVQIVSIPTKTSTHPFPVRPILAITLMVAFTLLAYANTFPVPFQFDDDPNIVLNPSTHLETFSLQWLNDLIRINYSQSLRIFAYFTFALNYYFGGLQVFGYHLVNLFIHLSSGLLLYGFLLLTLNLPSLRERYGPIAFPVALFTSVLFLVHPIQTQSVTYIVQRMASMAGMFYLLTLLLYVKGRLSSGRKRLLFWTGALLGFLLGFSTKENVAILPLFVALYEFYFFQHRSLGPRGRKALCYSIALVLLIGLLIGLIFGKRCIGFITQGYQTRDFSLTERVLTQFRVVLYYVTLLIYPAPSRLNLDYDFPTSHGILDPPTTLFSILIVCGLIGYGLWSIRKKPLVSYFILWYFGNLVIESSVFALEMVYEHRLYLPAIGPMVLFAVWVVKEWEKIKARLRLRLREDTASTRGDNGLQSPGVDGLSRWKDYPLWGLLVGVAAVLAVASYERNTIWKDPIALWEDCVKKSPNKARPRAALGYYLVRAKHYDRGIEAMQTALRLNPKAVDYVHYNLGETYAELRQNDKALAHLEEYARTHPGDPRVYNEIGLIKLERKEPNEAIQLFKRGLELNPFLKNLRADLHANLGNAYLQVNRPDQAMSEFRKALGFHPDLFQIYTKMGSGPEAIESYKRLIQLKPNDPDGYNNLGILYQAKGSYPEAIEAFQKAIEIRPNFPIALSNLGVAYSKTGRYREAIDVLKKAEQLNPKDAEISNNLGVAYRKAGQYREAVDSYRRALQLNPGDPEIHCNLGDAYFHLGRFGEAVEGYKQAIERNPKVELYHFNLGVAHSALGDYRAAMDAYQEALRINPNYAQARFNLGLTYLMLKKRELALQQYEMLKGIDKNRADKLLGIIKSAH